MWFEIVSMIYRQPELISLENIRSVRVMPNSTDGQPQSIVIAWNDGVAVEFRVLDPMAVYAQIKYKLERGKEIHIDTAA